MNFQMQPPSGYPKHLVRVGELMLLAGLYWYLVFVTQWRYGFAPGDEGLLWYISQRTLHGDVPILDWSSYDPARYYWCAVWFKLLGDDGLLQLRIADAAFGLLGYTAVMAAILHARMPRVIAIVIAVVLCMMFCVVRHKSYEQSESLVLVACAYLVLCRKWRYRWLVLGIATGVAAFIGRNCGVYFVAASFLLPILIWLQSDRLSRKLDLHAIIQWGLGVLIGYSPLLCMVAANPAFRDAFMQSVLAGSWQIPLPIQWPWTVAWRGSLTQYQHQLQLLSIFCAILPISYIAALAKSIGAHRNEPAMSALTGAAGIAGLSFLHHGFDRADFAHLAQATMPVVIAVAAFCMLLWRETDFPKRLFSAVYGLSTLAIVIALWAPLQPSVQYHASPGNYAGMSIHGERVHVPAPFKALVDAAQSALSGCSRRDGQLLVPRTPGVYAVLGLKAPYRELYYMKAVPVEIQNAYISALIRARTGIVMLDRTETIDDRADFRLPESYPLLVAFIESNYRKGASDPGPAETWVRADFCRQPN